MIEKLEPLRIAALRIFDENILRNILGDLEILDNVQPETHKNGCSVPTAMLVLSSLEFIGYILSEKGSKGRSEEYLRKAFEFKDFFPRQVYSDDVINDLAVFYRHGMMHSFYPIRTSSKIYGIHKSSQQNLFEMLSIQQKVITSLNVNVLSTDFKTFLCKFRDYLSRTLDNKILGTISRRFQITNLSAEGYSTTTDQTTISVGIKS